MSDNLRRYRAIQEALTQWYPINSVDPKDQINAKAKVVKIAIPASNSLRENRAT
jgi:hypothetical protein